jgi:hypothetical protein
MSHCPACYQCEIDGMLDILRSSDCVGYDIWEKEDILLAV